ncbi:hypothetical protein EVAR_25784_1 [Eumeta japonica]|uniref:Uncharacterized protein n=1 Tax=Eumeta variegata TaxID=151549 RepID=A0A4C1VVC3_EUMVA|nr:hypothetical protein EVAR_25784_1 [Eumeta japonica]
MIVTYITPFPREDPPPNLHQVVLNYPDEVLPSKILNIENILSDKQNINLNRMMHFFFNVHEHALRHENVQKLMTDQNENFDVAVIEWLYAECGLPKYFEHYCASPASPASPDSNSEMDFEREPRSRTTVHYLSDESEPDLGSDDSNDEEEPLIRVNKAKTNSGSAPSQDASLAPTPTTSWRNAGAKKNILSNIQPDNKSIKSENSELSVEGDIDTPPISVKRKVQRPPPHLSLGLIVQPESVTHFSNLSNLLATMKAAYHTYSLKEEREFRVVLKGVPKEFLLKDVKTDLAQ